MILPKSQSGLHFLRRRATKIAHRISTRSVQPRDGRNLEKSEDLMTNIENEPHGVAEKYKWSSLFSSSSRSRKVGTTFLIFKPSSRKDGAITSKECSSKL